MLDLTTNRLDYGEQLKAPEGYRLDLGIATTFSLDLEALVAASLALNLDQTLEGDLSGERLALLESLDQLQEKLLVFYQRGCIKVPQNFNRLFTLLEKLLVPSSSMEGPRGAFASFHPKIWLLRFAPTEGKNPVLVRLLVLSRNLTFDRSWDLAVALDGHAVTRGGKADIRLLDFLRSLSQDDAYSERIESMCQTLAAVDWAPLNGFDTISMLPGIASNDSQASSTPIDLDGNLDELLVMSPFVDAGPNSLLQELGGRTWGTKTLISRPDTLDAIGETALDGWVVKSLSNLIRDGEERLEREDPMPQSLHAKLIVAKTGSKAIWHIGSANMTDAAFGQPAKNVPPRNREFMLRLTGNNSKVGPTKLLEEWSTADIFNQHVFTEPTNPPLEGNQEYRKFVFQLTSAKWTIHATQNADESFTVALSVLPLPELPDGLSVRVALLCRPSSAQTLSADTVWNNIGLTEISAFVPVEITASDGPTQHFAIQAAFSVDLLDARKRAIFKETVGPPEKLIRYLTLLLDTGASKAKWFRADEGDGGGADIFGLDGHGALYEQLLRASSRAPDRLGRALRIFERIRDEEVTLPDGLEELFEGFAAFAKEQN